MTIPDIEKIKNVDIFQRITTLEEQAKLYHEQNTRLLEFVAITQKQIGELQEHALKLEKQIWELQDQQKQD